ncbi:MAG: hypothetical protein ACK4J0_00130 [Candidatus Anstonellaceae archaeon]
MFKDEKTFLIATKIIKKHLSYLKRGGLNIEIKQKNNEIEYEINTKKIGKEYIKKNASKLMDLLIKLDDI